jgi:hypothetical protein
MDFNWTRYLTPEDLISELYINLAQYIQGTYMSDGYIYLYFKIKKNQAIDDKDIEILLENGQYYPYNELIFKTMIDNIMKLYDISKITEEQIKKMIANKYFSDFVKKHDFPMTEEDLMIAIINDNECIIDYIIEKYNYNLETKHLEIACKYSNNDTIHKILQNKIQISQKSFDYILNRSYVQYNKISQEFYGGEELDDVSGLKLLCNYGFQIKQNDLYNLMKKKIYIKNYKIYNLILDDKIKKICAEDLFFPYSEIKFEKDMFVHLFRHNLPMSQIKIIEKKYNCIATVECLKEACSHDNANTRLIHWLVEEKKIKPNQECVFSIVKYSNNINIINYISSKYFNNDKILVLQQNNDEYDYLKKYEHKYNGI